MKRSNFFVLIIVAAVIGLGIILVSCKDSSGIKNVGDIVFPPNNISYEKTIQPLFNVGCTLSGCHDNQTRADDLELTSYYEATEAKPGVVIPRDTAHSRLIWEIDGKEGDPADARFHLLNSNQVTGFRQWILEGAKDTQ
jgi:hypothetical protein